jgi:signal transduction histidine kinase
MSEPEAIDPRATAALYRIARLAASTDDPAGALRETLAVIVGTLGADAGSISLLSPDTGDLVTEVEHGYERAAVAPDQLRPGHGVTGWCALNRRPVLVPDVRLEPRYIAVRSSTRSEMAAPIVVQDQMVGVVDLESDRPAAFTAANLETLGLLAHEAGVVMQRLWQLGHLRAKARQLESLITAGQSLVAKLEQQEILATLTREACRMLEARACVFYLLDTTTRRLRCAASSAAPELQVPEGEFDLEGCLFASPVHTRRQIWFQNLCSPEFLEMPDMPRGAGLGSVLSTPVVFENDVLGVLAVFSAGTHRFDNDEKRLCAALAGLGAVALQNARLYARVFRSEDVLRKNERLTTLGLLAAEIAHEIRNPLTVIKLLYGGLGGDFAPGDPRVTDLRVIGEKLDQLEAIVTRVLGFAKAPSSLHSRWSLAEVIEDTLVLVRLKLSQQKVTVEFPAPARPVFVEAHKGQLQQVLLNLLLNATEAMPAGGSIRLHLQVIEGGDAPRARLDITDTGGGVPESLRHRIFDSFLSGRPDGTGLGLAIAKRILASHRGDIELAATSPSGTTMRVTLPLAK